MVVSCYEEGAWQWAELELGHVCREPGVRVTIENKSCVSARSSCDVAQDVGSWTRPRSCSCQLRSPAEPQFTEPESLAAAAARGAGKIIK